MSSISMAIGGHNITIEGKVSNPGTLNAYLRSHKGYDNQNDLEESVIPSINPKLISVRELTCLVLTLASGQLMACIEARI